MIRHSKKAIFLLRKNIPTRGGPQPRRPLAHPANNHRPPRRSNTSKSINLGFASLPQNNATKRDEIKTKKRPQTLILEKINGGIEATGAGGEGGGS